MKADEINSHDSLQAWLNFRPEDTCHSDSIAIGLFTALRVFPLWSGAMDQEWAQKGGLTALPVLRCNLLSGVARRYLTPKVKYAATTASAAATTAANAAKASAAMGATNFSAEEADAAATTAAQITAAVTFAEASFAEATFAAATFAIARTTSDVPGNFGTSRANTAAAVGANVAAAWSWIRSDARQIEAGLDLADIPLWPDSPTYWFTAADTRAREIWSRDPETWDFWLRWWEGVLSGNQLDWELQKAVALEIPEEAWSDPKTVAAHIRMIEEREALRRENARLKAMLVEAKLSTSAGAEHRGHNNPPELIDLPEEVQSALSEIDAQLEIAAAELEAPSPSSAKLKVAGAVLIASAKTISVYAGRKVDVVIDAAAKAVGVGLGTGFVAWLTTTFWEPFVSFGQSILDFASKLP